MMAPQSLPGGEFNWITVCEYTGFGPGQSRLLAHEDLDIAVFNLDGTYYAISDICTHAGHAMLGCGLAPEELIFGDELMCPRHGARFSIRSGEALLPPAYKPLPTYPVRVENDLIQVGVPVPPRA